MCLHPIDFITSNQPLESQNFWGSVVGFENLQRPVDAFESQNLATLDAQR